MDDDFSDARPASRAKPNKPVKFRPTRLRIIAGKLRSRLIEYNGDPATRPMKDKTREAVFSLLGGYLDDSYAIDLFAGTGILGFEAISRGSEGALLLELSRSVVTTLLANMRSLKLDDKVQIQNVDTIRWLKSAGPQTTGLPKVPWIIFCCPPYSLWRNDGPRLIEGLENLMLSAPQGSQLLCETEDNYDLPPLMPKWSWDVRHYKPASVSIARKYSQNPEVDGTVDKP